MPNDTRRRTVFSQSAAAVGGGVIVSALVAFALIGPLIVRHGPLESDFAHGMAPDHSPVGPSLAFPLGADRLFRDVLARLAVGGRISLCVACGATIVSSVLGVAVGVAAGWFEGARVLLPWSFVGGVVGAAMALALGQPAVATAAALAGALFGFRWFPLYGPRVDLDAWLMRLVDVMLAFPFLLLVMAIGAAVGRTTATTVALTLGATGWVGMARVLRAKTMQVRALDYIEASRALGQPTLRLIAKHVLPSIAGSIIVMATIQVAQMIVADSVLGYLGVGISPPTPTWGRMLQEGQDEYVTAPWLVAAPATAIFLAVCGFNMLGEGLRDALDPRRA